MANYHMGESYATRRHGSSQAQFHLAGLGRNDGFYRMGRRVSTLLAATLIASGLATSYSDGVMAEVVANRIAWNQLPPDTDAAQGVALLTCDRLGDRVWITTPTRIVQATVTDCAQAGHRAELLERGWAVDLSAELAAELGAVRAPLAGVQVWDGVPMRMVGR